MRASSRLLSAGRFPYPRDVWLRSGGYWQEPKHAKRNFYFAILGLTIVGYGWVRFAAERTWYSRAPAFWTPDMLINKQFRTGELKQRDINQGPPPGWKLPGPRQLQVGGPLVNPDGSDFEEAEEAEG